MRTASILLTLALAAVAQDAPTELLKSPSLRDRAWGAYQAGQLHSDVGHQALRDAFRDAAPMNTAKGVYGGPISEEFAFVAALFDAAIQSKMVVPGDLLEPFAATWPSPVIILLARDPQSDDLLLHMREHARYNPEWVAINNLLAARKSQRFFARVLAEAEISHTFTLLDPGAAARHEPSTGGSACGDGILIFPHGFPPTNHYEIVERDGLLLAPGPRNSYYRATLVATDQRTGFGACAQQLDRRAMAVEYLAPLGRMTGQEALALFQQERRVEFTSMTDFDKRCDSALYAQETALRAFFHSAAENGFGEVRGTTVRIVTKVDDQRKISSGPAPSITAREFTIQ
jgi:hypothetical protein